MSCLKEGIRQETKGLRVRVGTYIEGGRGADGSLRPADDPLPIPPQLAGAVRAVLTVMLAMAIVAIPLLAHLVHLALGLLAVIIVASTCAICSPSTSILAIQFSFIFQNLIVSLLANHIQTADDFDMIRAYNFFLLCVTWLTLSVIFLSRRQSYPPALIPFLKISIATLVVIGIYFVIGFAIYGVAAIASLRNLATPLLFFQICLVVFSSHPARLGPAMTASAILVILCGAMEFLYRKAWLHYTNGETYWSLAGGSNWETLAYDKQASRTGEVVTTLSDTFIIDFFNSPLLSDLGIEMMRMFGPNMHAISFAYCLAFFCIFALYRGHFIQAALLFALLFLCNAKGPLIVFFMVGISWSIWWLFGTRVAFLAQIFMVAVYALVGTLIGQQIGDYHVLGLMAGLHDFAGNPIGHGVGAGGNLSPLFASIQWEDAQAAGRTPFPVESSVGVLMYQLGIFAFLVIGTYAWISSSVIQLARRTGNSLHAAVSFAILAVVGTGLFQEEAYFAPLSLAMYLGLAGMILGAAIRSDLIRQA